mmetsp:Transcript_14195/g.20634  ORF Transcript_14195/g.20634 Transcript_14195/m.20634 type:complete len:373 (-) Transcript_14195:1356-2474(-)
MSFVLRSLRIAVRESQHGVIKHLGRPDPRSALMGCRRTSTSTGQRRQTPASIPIIALEIKTDGTIRERHLQKSDVAADLHLNYRDLRVVDPSFRSETAMFLARSSAIVVHLEHIRALVQANRILLFDPNHPRVQAFLPELRDRLKQEKHPLPYELRALEAILINVCGTLNRSLLTLSPSVESVLDTLSSSTTAGFGSVQVAQSLDRLLPLENSMNEFGSQVEQIRNAMIEVLENDEDMSEMYLTDKMVTGHRRRTDQHEDVEMMFETYLKQVDSILNEIRSIAKEVEVTENVIQIRLDAARNRILRLEVYLNLVTMSLAAGALFAGVFGMNLTSGYEEHPYAFYIVSTSLLGSSVLFFKGSMAYLRFKRIFP